MFLCSECLITTFIGAIRSHKGNLLSYYVFFFFSSWPSKTNFMYLLWKLYTLNFSFQVLCRIVESCFELLTFQFEKESLIALTSMFILLPFLQYAGKHRWLKFPSFLSFIDVSYYIFAPH